MQNRKKIEGLNIKEKGGKKDKKVSAKENFVGGKKIARSRRG